MDTPLIGASESIEKTRELVKHVADTGLNTVISGESGVGKEVVARNLYNASPRKGKPFVKINCAALPSGLLESELFGYERGAFTGADQKTRGKFELAHKGVLFLDEIADMSLRLQAKLLHVLQSGEFSPLGSEKEVKADCWVIAATNQKLENCVSKKVFREDLYYRLNIIQIEIPPLRTRPEDIPLLIDYYLDMYSAQFETRVLTKPSAQILEKFCTYRWPGNVRELQNTLQRYFVLENWDDVINSFNRSNSREEELPHNAGQSGHYSVLEKYFKLDDGNLVFESDFSLKKARKEIVEGIEKEIISQVLKKTGWNRVKASKILKISYKTLLYKISDLRIEPIAK